MPKSTGVQNRVDKEGRLDLLLLGIAEVLTRKRIVPRMAPVIANVQLQTGQVIDLYKDVVEPLTKKAIKRLGIPKRNVLAPVRRLR